MDAGWRWAEDVVAGKVVSGQHVRNACKRALLDLKEDGPYRYDQQKADDIVAFFTLLRLSGGEYDDKPFVLFPWQEFLVRQLYGWVRKDTGTRRFKFAYIETAKGSGKSPLVAALALHSICADNEPKAQCFIIAKNAEQANITFKSAEEFAGCSPWFRERFAVYGGINAGRIIDKVTGGSIKRTTASTSGKGRSGHIPHMIVVDEYHEHDTSAQRDMYVAGTKNQKEPLTITITNAGVSKTSPCGQEHELATKVASGEVDNPIYFSMVFACDEDDKPMEDESVWQKANPSLPHIPGLEYIRDQIDMAKGLPSNRSVVERLNFCRWMGAEAPWFDYETWEACEVKEFPKEVYEYPCYVGLDLSIKTDLTSAAIVWDTGDLLYAKSYSWLPEDNLEQREQRDNQPYRSYADAGWLDLTPGKVVDYDYVADWVAEVFATNDLQALAYDPYRMDVFLKALSDKGIRPYEEDISGLRILRHKQGFAPGNFNSKGDFINPDPDKDPVLYISRSIENMEDAILKGKLKVEYNLCLRAAVHGAVLETNPLGDRRMNKRTSTTRIDPAIALTQAVGAAYAVRVGLDLGPVEDVRELALDWDEMIRRIKEEG